MMGETAYPLVVYGPSGEPCDVHSAKEEDQKTAEGYTRHWHMGGRFGLTDREGAPMVVPPKKSVGRPRKVRPDDPAKE